MQIKISSLVVASVLCVTAVVAFPDASGNVFIPATATDARSPCPGLNTLANHGYIPRDGRNFTIATLMNGTLGAFENPVIDIETYPPPASGLQFGLGAHPGGGEIRHNLIEHDASISRNDFGPDGTGDNVHFNETTFSTLANSNPGKDYYEPASSGDVQRLRLAHSVATNPNVTNTRKEFLLRSRESALYLSIFGNPLTGEAPKKFVNIFFREERLPIAEGWKKPTTLITVDTLGPLEDTIHNASVWTATQPCEPLRLGPDLVL